MKANSIKRKLTTAEGIVRMFTAEESILIEAKPNSTFIP